jgi:hypothetical protein
LLAQVSNGGHAAGQRCGAGNERHGRFLVSLLALSC